MILGNELLNPDALLAKLREQVERDRVTEKPARIHMPINEFVLAAMSVALVTAVSFLIEPFTGYLSIALLYLLLVVAVGLKLNRGPVLTVATASALLWNVLFIPPRFTIYIDKLDDAMMFAMFFVVAVAMGHLTSRLRLSEAAERRRERRTAALYELAHQAALDRKSVV